ncbi:MAG: VTT domain-containing protein [Flavobacteriales bacterium]|nr:VTT domain-containing protein [Flavobacteriales bacterium]
MKRLALILLFACVFILTTFFLFADFEAYVEHTLSGEHPTLIYICLSGIFLFSDILFPIPSSLIMLLNGKVLGVLGGGLLSWFAGFTSSWIGFILGRKSSRYVDRFFSEEEIRQGNAFYERYGKMSVALSRALPVLSESVSVVSGVTTMKTTTFLIYAGIGHLIISFLYAYLGAVIPEASGHWITVVIVMSTVVLSWLVSKLLCK